MTLLDTRLRAAAERLVSQYGKAMVLRRNGTATYDPGTGNATSTPVEVDVTGVITAPSNQMLGLGLAQASDRVVLLAAKPLSIAPAAGDQLVMDDQTWQVLTVRSMFSGEEVATYELLARK